MLIMAACSAQKPKEAGDLNQSETNQEQKNIDFPSDYLTDIVETAKKGMTDTSPFNVLSNTIEQVEMQWEEPVRTDHVGNGFYATYDNKNTVLDRKSVV